MRKYSSDDRCRPNKIMQTLGQFGFECEQPGTFAGCYHKFDNAAGIVLE